MCLMCRHLGLIVLDHGCQHVDVIDRHLNRTERNDITQGLPESDPLAFFKCLPEAGGLPIRAHYSYGQKLHVCGGGVTSCLS